MKRLLGLTLLTIILASIGVAAPLYTMYVDPYASYFRADPLDGGAGSAWFIDLGSLGLLPGQELTITASGDLCYFDGCSTEMAAGYGLVFTSDTSVASSSNQFRLNVADSGNVPTGATGTASPQTFPGLYDTDIPEDFMLMDGESVTVIIPTGGAYLAIGLWDSYFADNSDPTPNLGITVSTADSLVPEPSTYLMAFAGLAGLWALRRKQA